MEIAEIFKNKGEIYRKMKKRHFTNIKKNILLLRLVEEHF